MLTSEIASQVAAIFTEQFGAEAFAALEKNPAPFKSASEVNRFGNELDSLDHIEFIMAVEDHFCIDIDDATEATIRTLDDAVRVVQANLGGHGQ